jgi:type I restriction enzyme S subunit
MVEWEPVKIGDFVDIKHGYAFKGAYITDEPTENILVTPGNFNIGGGFKSAKFKYYKGEVPREYVLKPNDIIVTMTDLSKESDTLGYSAKVPASDSVRYLHNQRIGLVQFFEKEKQKIVQDFVYWLMRTGDYQGFIVGSASGSSVMHTSPTRMREYQFLRPQPDEQKAIASVLSSLDDKIDLLHRQNKTLEAMAETLFRQWFVEEAQEDWEEGKLGDLFDISSGKALKRDQLNDAGEVPVLGANGEIGRTSDYLFEERLIFTGRVGTLGNIFIVNGDKVWLSDNTLVFRKIRWFYFVYFTLKSSHIEDFNVGSTQPLVRQSDIKEIPVNIPSNEKLGFFEDSVSHLFEKIERNQNQIRTLEKLRDTLLPKLMSGEVRVDYERLDY